MDIAATESKDVAPENGDARQLDGLTLSADGTTVVACEPLEGRVVVPEGILAIGDEAFRAVPVEEVVLPSTLRRIGSEAFALTKIERIAIPASVDEIGEGAFSCMFDEGFSDRWFNPDKPVWVDVSEDNATFESWNGSLVQRLPQGYRLLSL